MKNAITSVNKWFSVNFADLNPIFSPGEPAELPAVVLLPRKTREMAKKLGGEVMLAEIVFAAECIADGGNSAAAREIAARIAAQLLGDADTGLKIPHYKWDYAQCPPAPSETLGEMAVTGVEIDEKYDEKLPEIRRVRVEFKVRAKLAGGAPA